MTCPECSQPATGPCNSCKREFCDTHAPITDFGRMCRDCAYRFRRNLTWTLRGCVVAVVAVFVGLIVWNVLVW
jgi:hypothetical protein